MHAQPFSSSQSEPIRMGVSPVHWSGKRDTSPPTTLHLHPHLRVVEMYCMSVDFPPCPEASASYNWLRRLSAAGSMPEPQPEAERRTS
jgi:hypothetical protein